MVDLSQRQHDPNILAELRHRYPNMTAPSPASDDAIIRDVYSTETSRQYGHRSYAPMLRPRPPTTHETHADPVGRAKHPRYPPMDLFITPKRSRPGNECLYSWRQLHTVPGHATWQPLEKIPVLTNVGERSTYLPIRLPTHDPSHEKERWNNIRRLIRNNTLAYGYRCQAPGFAGHRQMDESLCSSVEMDPSQLDNKAMQSTAQAVYQQFPLDVYNQTQAEQANKHLGHISRMVTLTHPFNPFTQQSAYCNTSAQTTK